MQPTILIVDDEKHTRDGLRRLLENDYDVYVAGDIASAMNVLEREHGGELSIESSEGKGLTVTIRLPLIDRRVRMLEAGERKAE